MGAIAAAYPLLTTAAAGAVGSLAVGALTSKPAAAPAAAPTVTPPTPMPDDKAVRQAAARTSLMEQQRRRGRASTILTDPADSATDPLGA